MIYCDTSLLIAAMSAEPNSAVALDWLDRHRSQLAASAWVATEIAGAIATKARRGAIDVRQRAVMAAEWHRMATRNLVLLPIDESHYARAGQLVDAAPRGLRAGDALHLAIVLGHGCALATFDRDMAAAAAQLGVVVHPSTAPSHP